MAVNGKQWKSRTLNWKISWRMDEYGCTVGNCLDQKETVRREESDAAGRGVVQAVGCVDGAGT
jgi:hypothetical protein